MAKMYLFGPDPLSEGPIEVEHSVSTEGPHFEPTERISGREFAGGFEVPLALAGEEFEICIRGMVWDLFSLADSWTPLRGFPWIAKGRATLGAKLTGLVSEKTLTRCFLLAPGIEVRTLGVAFLGRPASESLIAEIDAVQMRGCVVRRKFKAGYSIWGVTPHNITPGWEREFSC